MLTANDLKDSILGRFRLTKQNNNINYINNNNINYINNNNINYFNNNKINKRNNIIVVAIAFFLLVPSFQYVETATNNNNISNTNNNSINTTINNNNSNLKITTPSTITPNDITKITTNTSSTQPLANIQKLENDNLTNNNNNNNVNNNNNKDTDNDPEKNEDDIICTDPVLCRKDFNQVINMIINASGVVNIPGMAMSVVYDGGSKIWTRGVGIKNLKPTDNHVDPNITKFAIGSISKSFTTSLIAILLDENRHKYPKCWDTPLKEVMGSSFTLTSDHCHHSSTIKDVLAHRMALKSYSILLLMGTGLDKPTLEFCRRMSLLESDGDYRVTYSYSNMMYVLAGCIAEIMGQDSFSNLLRKKLLEPLEMNDTLVFEDSMLNGWADVSESFYLESGQLKIMHTDMLRSIEKFPSAGGILSTALDMTKWIKFHFNFGKLEDGRQLVDPNIWSEMHKSHMPISIYPVIHEFESYPVHYSTGFYELGWMTSRYRDQKASVHGGRISGFDSFVSVYPSKQFGVFTTTNGQAYNNFDFQKAAHLALYDLFNGNDVWLNNSIMAKFDQSFRSSPSNKSNHNENKTKPNLTVRIDSRFYVGIYGHQLFGNLTVHAKRHRRSHRNLRSHRSHASDDLYFKYGLVGKGKLSFASNDTCTIHYLDHLDHFNHLESAYYYRFKFHFNDFDSRRGKYNSLTLVGMSEKVVTTFRRGVTWHPFVDVNENHQSYSSKLVCKFNVLLALAVIERLISRLTAC
ncbi:hypothetical protein HELRODRAFT_194066 [Helobdella robusta]|uniref:Beta-lactamase-related domain-containing protein n=1 Tax=Helobdella robusta TaxID=6412 RepID=T1FVM9_HELRO|nr:hypothetical protein HELRODRAFT_194066 [Helobdella robusta]ESN93548.1 hypothetical protein HELRODRAFT_194066 [Helobdella robusta]